MNPPNFPAADSPDSENRDGNIRAGKTRDGVSSQNKNADQEIRRVGQIGIYMLGSRILGLFRDILLAALFGANGSSDALRAALRIPVMLRDMLSEGALSASFSPAYREQQRSADPQANQRFASAAFSAVTTLSLITLALLYWQAEAVIDTIFPFKDLEQREQAITGFRLLLPYLAIIPFIAIFRGLLHCHRRDPQTMRPQILQNLALIASGVVLLLSTPDELVRAQTWIWAFLGGAAIGVLLMARDVSKIAPIPRPTLHLRVPGQRRFLLDFGSLLISQVLVQSYSLLAFHLASGLGDGSLTCLEIAFRFHFFPIALIGVSSGIVAGDESADLLSRGQRGQLARMFTRNQRLTVFVGMVAAAGLMATSTPVIESLFVWGKFTTAAADETAPILMWYCLAIPFATLNIGLQRTAITLGLRRAVLAVTFFGLALQVGILLGGFFEITTGLIAQSYGISALLSWLALQLLIRKSLSLPRLRWKQGIKLLALSILVHQGAFHLLNQMQILLPDFTGKDLLLLLGAVSFGILLTTWIGRILKIREVEQMWLVFNTATGRIGR
ncbi:MAG: hypothetical protein CBC13_05810 [Planctomycetia bacterium TMED53]|nr:MAG: hypothetical protein CBC13_05810 [Planctomycetia bacterium TMED53]